MCADKQRVKHLRPNRKWFSLSDEKLIDYVQRGTLRPVVMWKTGHPIDLNGLPLPWQRGATFRPWLWVRMADTPPPRSSTVWHRKDVDVGWWLAMARLAKLRLAYAIVQARGRPAVKVRLRSWKPGRSDPVSRMLSVTAAKSKAPRRPTSAVEVAP